MLLSGLFILIGAMVLPSKLELLYSTHILVMCLYLITTKRLIALCLLVISLAALLFHEYDPADNAPLEVGQTLYVDWSKTDLWLLSASLTSVEKLPARYQVRWLNARGEYQTVQDMGLNIGPEGQLSLFKTDFHQARLMKITPAAREGSWLARKLFAERYQAQLTLHFSQLPSQLNTAHKAPALLQLLQPMFKGFRSWPFSRALLFGANQQWSEKDTWLIRSLGLAHLFVVSGLHAGFVFLLGSVLAKALWWLIPGSCLLAGFSKNHLNLMVCLPLLFAYGYLTQWGEPIIRASLMLGVLLAARLYAHRFSVYQILSLVLWLILMHEPRSILQASLWLSFSMVLLLIAFCQPVMGRSRLLRLQIMLSLASMVLIWGWQSELSGLSIFLNLLLVPFVALIWFPVAMLSCAEALVIGSSHLYTLLDSLLGYLLRGLDWVAFDVSLFSIAPLYFDYLRWLLIFLLLYWVFQVPLRRGYLAALLIVLVLYEPQSLWFREGSYRLLNKHHEFALRRDSEWLVAGSWFGHERPFISLADFISKVPPGIVFTQLDDILPLSHSLMSQQVLWLILAKPPKPQERVLLTALKIPWLVIKDGEYLDLYPQQQAMQIHFATCYFTFFTFKSDTCKRIETLENMLN